MNNHRVKIFDLSIDALSMQTVLERARGIIEKRVPSQIVTVNAEFLVAAEHDDSFRAILRESALNTPDGFGVLWAAKYLSLPLTWKTWLSLEAFLQIFSSGFFSLFSAKYARSVISEKVSGVELVWKLCELAENEGYSIFFLGGFADTPASVESAVKVKFPRLKVAGAYSGSPGDFDLLQRLKRAKPDILLVAYGPVRQEKWIAENLKNLGIPLCLGVGGTFDYIAGKKPLAPQILREMGLEWAFRLITQPYRLKRVFTAVPVFVSYVYKCKLIRRRPYRTSLALCLKNSKGEVLICRRTKDRTNDVKEHWQLPHGGMEAGESKEQALRREMLEELNLSDFQIVAWADDVHRYDWPIPFARFYKHRYRGQNISVAYATARPAVLEKITPDKREHDGFKWVKPEALLMSVHPVQKALTQVILKTFPFFKLDQ